MYLREVVINGFKSFADSTSIVLGKGITCIVGPNGCGKSNIVDAIRWVLGEQSAKALRGGKMQDVIFVGTDQRKPLPLCEVTLAFADCEKELGTAFNEVEITRRVTRDGGSDYYINGKVCRLKDIQRLFMDTGVGRVSYSFMVQGQIDQILSSNPAERRVIFEEAAGITRYKSQRREALGKLALVDQNLSRVTDVIEEVTRQIGSLKRQASKALRYKRLKHRLTHLELADAGYHHTRRQAIIAELETRYQTLKSDVETGLEALGVKESSLTERKQERAERYEALQTAQQNVYDLRSQKEQAGNQAALAKVRCTDLGERITEVEREIALLQEQREGIRQRAEDDSRNRGSQLELVQTSDQQFKEKSMAFEGILQKLKQAEVDLQERRRDLLVAEGGITRLRSNATTLEVDLKSFQVKHAALGDSVFQLREERGVLEEKLQAVLDTQTDREKARAGAQTAVETAQARCTELRLAYREQQSRIQELDRELARDQANLSILEGLQAKFEGFSEGAKAILQGQLGEALPKDRVIPLSRHLVIQQAEWADALETLLGTAAEALLLEDRPTAARASQALIEKKLGRACLKVPTPTPAQTGTLDAPGGLVPAAAVVKAKTAAIQPHLDALLDGCFFAPTLEDFLAFWETSPDFAFTLVATPAGELIDQRGIVQGGFQRARKKESSFIQRETEIARLKTALTEKNDRLTGLHEEAMRLQAELEQAETVVEEKRHAVVELGQLLSSLQTEAKAARQLLAQNEESTTRQQRQLDELEESRDNAEKRLVDARQQMEEGEKRITTLKAESAALEEKLVQLRTERDQHYDSLSEVRLDLADKKQRLELITRGLNEVEQQRRDIENRLQRRGQEIDTLREQIAELQTEEREQTQRAAELTQTLEITLASLETDRQALTAVEQAIRQTEEGLTGERTAQRDNETKLNQVELKLTEERTQARFLIEKVQSEYQLEIESIDWRRELWQADEEFEVRLKLDDLDEDSGDVQTKPKRERGEPNEADLAAMDTTDWEALAGEVRTLRDKINAMGPVNLVAIEEYAELRERFDFLKTQSDDLWKAKEELVKAIDEINTTSQQLFKETFEQIRKNFTFTFNKLFGGGEADLNLVEAEDVLDSGIDIIARPPGTKLRSLSLLSGGQRTMTAVSLLFAIYMVKPSPFCVLDELDAPLDDANVGRYTDILREFTRYSQFLVITHNKRTVSAADTIYGVTMQERGVTRMVSMRFNHETGRTQSLEDAQPAAQI